MASFSLPTDIGFRPLQPEDVGQVLSIIAQVDEDEVAEAEASYQDDLDGQFVLTHLNEIVGVTGAAYAERTDNSYWMSWTYLDQNYIGGGVLQCMLSAMLTELEKWRARKVFVQLSDYTDLDQRAYLDELKKAYSMVGFSEELRHYDYFDRNITLVTLGHTLAGQSQGITGEPLETIHDLAVPTGFGEIPETTGAYYIDWDFTDAPQAQLDLWHKMLNQISRAGGRVAFVGITQDAVGVANLVRQVGFKDAGRVRDYYAAGIDDVHFRYQLG